MTPFFQQATSELGSLGNFGMSGNFILVEFKGNSRPDNRYQLVTVKWYFPLMLMCTVTYVSVCNK